MMFKLFKDEFPLDISDEQIFKDGELRRLDRLLKEQIEAKFSSKLNLFIVDSGSCSGCELELQTLFTPLYNISKNGIEVVYNIKEADILVITGLMTENMYGEVVKLYEALKEPKYVILLGDCPLLRGVFQDNFSLKRPVDIPFNAFHPIMGCPPEPKIILTELLKYLKKL